MTGEKRAALPQTDAERVVALLQENAELREELRGAEQALARAAEAIGIACPPTMAGSVAAFHDKFGLPYAATHGGARGPQLLSVEEFRYRLAFLQEEVDEFHDAHRAGDLAGAADALADVAWVAIGTAHFMGLPFDEIWTEVRRANMEKTLKADDGPEHKRGAIEKISKPKGWTPPMIDAILKRYLGV